MRTCAICGKEFDTNGDACLECLENQIKGITQDAAVINRAENLALNHLAMLSGSEAVHADLEHYNFTVVSVMRGQDGVLLPDWNVRVSEHIAALRRKQELYKVHEGAARRARLDAQVVVTEKLTPEERDKYIKASISERKLPSDKKIEKEAKKTQSLIEKQISALLNLGISAESDMIKTLRSKMK